MRLRPVCLLAAFAAGAAVSPAAETLIRDADAPNSTFGGIFINNLVGAGAFYDSGYYGQNVVAANAEAGHIWGSASLADTNSHLTLRGRVARFVGDPAFSDANPATREFDFHATMVGNAMGGLINNPTQFGFEVGSGIAPLSTMWSGAIATSWNTPGAEGRPTGSFNISDASFHSVYSDFFLGGPSGRAGVVNSSWGDNSDTSGSGGLALAGDGLAAASPSTVFVVSAGNDGIDGPGTVSALAAGFNTISVGALGPASNYGVRAGFSSHGAADFFNPVTLETLNNVRAAVDLVAPGDNLSLAAYLGASGGNSNALGGTNPYAAFGNPDSLFFLGIGGTSFSAPIVSGGVALMKSYAQINYAGNAERLAASLDARVIKSILQNTTSKLSGWDNGTANVSGVLTTTQALDYDTGAGALNLARVFRLLDSGSTTHDVPGLVGGLVEWQGFDLGSVSASSPLNTYFINAPTDGLVTVTLNWFAGRTYAYDTLTETINAQDVSLANLQLELWSVGPGQTLDTLIALSAAGYDTTEHLHFTLPAMAEYAIVVRRLGTVYGTENETSYGLSWIVPEPSAYAACAGLAVLAFSWRRRRRR